MVAGGQGDMAARHHRPSVVEVGGGEDPNVVVECRVDAGGETVMRVIEGLEGQQLKWSWAT
jgi:hypothetical protein